MFLKNHHKFKDTYGLIKSGKIMEGKNDTDSDEQIQIQLKASYLIPICCTMFSLVNYFSDMFGP
jgi:hypothetical protein